MNLADMDIEVATRILVLECESLVAQAEARMLACIEGFRSNPGEDAARDVMASHDAWTEARLDLARAEADQHLSAVIEEMESMEELDTWTEADRLDMGDRGATAAHGGELASRD